MKMSTPHCARRLKDNCVLYLSCRAVSCAQKENEVDALYTCALRTVFREVFAFI